MLEDFARLVSQVSGISGLQQGVCVTCLLEDFALYVVVGGRVWFEEQKAEGLASRNLGHLGLRLRLRRRCRPLYPIRPYTI